MIILCMHMPSCVWKQYWEWHAMNDKYFGGLKVLRFAGFIRYVGKGFVIFSITTFIATFMLFQPYKTAMSILTKASCSSHGFSLKLSLAYSEMDESTLLTHVCADFTLSRMTMHSQEEKSYSWSESKMKQLQITNCFQVTS